MSKRMIYSSLLLLLLVDIGYSFMQHYSANLDGDMGWGIVPSKDVKPVLESPLGLEVILNHNKYVNPNRFFSHWTFRKYFLTMPVFLQRFVSPVDSVYLSCAIIKTIVQVFLIYLLSLVISGTKNLLKMDFVISAVLITPLFQTNGYKNYMAIIDQSPTYVFFYALPCSILLFYMLPFIFQFYHEKKLIAQLFIKILWIPFALIVCLSGPLNPGAVLIFSTLLFLRNLCANYFQSNKVGVINKMVNAVKSVPGNYYFYLSPIYIFSLYSLYIARANTITIASQIPLSEMYLRLPVGIYYQFTQKLGFPLLFIMLVLNAIIINYRYKTDNGKKILNLFKWTALFSLLYILLLPLGGYRDYRHYILRYDTIMPITLSLMIIFGLSTLFLINSLQFKFKYWYLLLIAGVLFIYTNSDRPEFYKNKIERTALKELSESKDLIVQLPGDHLILTWGDNKCLKPEDSELNAELLMIWNITDKKKLYYNK